MKLSHTTGLRRWVCSLLGIVLLGGVTLGCGKPPEKTPAEKEKIQEDHKERASRELQDG